MPAARPDRSARRTFRLDCLRKGFPLKEESAVLRTTSMPLRASTNAALNCTPTIADDYDLGAASVSHDPTRIYQRCAQLHRPPPTSTAPPSDALDNRSTLIAQR
jgi:hypothetical protein